MADEEIFANASAAAVNARQVAEAAQHYRYELSWVEGAIRSAYQAAGHPAVEHGYEAFSGAANAQLNRIQQHGADAASALHGSVAVVSDTDATNAGLLDRAAAGFPNGGH